MISTKDTALILYVNIIFKCTDMFTLQFKYDRCTVIKSTIL